MALRALPIDPLLPDLVARWRATKRLVLEAPPGAGKTTRVPAALLDAGAVGDREVLVLEPRRLAARMSARRVAEERGEALGDRVGFAVRFESVGGPRTRLRYVTEGVFARRWLADPHLEGVGAVVLDEFHERHLATDVALAACRRLQEGPRPDLLLGVLSATLDADAVAAYLPGCARVRSEGRAYEVAIEYAAHRDDRPLEAQVAAAVGRLAAAGLDGDVLVFLPGAGEIRRAADALRGLAGAHDLLVVALHGDLPADEQDRAVAPSPRRKVILSTNVAETSITIDGVTSVVDGGLVRTASVSPWSGLSRLATEKASRASATQRAGRAGRTRPGRCLRLYTKPDHDARPAFDRPEVARADLCETVLELRAAGVTEPAAFPWFEAPPPAALEAADRLLARLGAVAPDGTLSATGRALLRIPAHPRLARLVLEAARRGVAEEGALAAALLSERDLRLSSRPAGLSGGRSGGRGGPSRAGAHADAGTSDLVAMLDAYDDAVAVRFDPDRLRSRGIDAFAARAVDRTAQRLVPLATGLVSPRPPRPQDPEAALGVAVLAGFPDRVARRRRAGEPEVLLCGGGSATLGAESVVSEAELLVAVDAEERPRGGLFVRVASAIDAEALLEIDPDGLREETDVRWDAAGERAEASRRVSWDRLVLEETRHRGATGPEVSKRLAEEARRAGARAFVEAEALDRLLARAAFVAQAAPDAGVPALSEDDVADAIASLCEGRASFRELREADPLEAVLARLPAGARRALDAVAPERVSLPGGWSPRVEYAKGRPPWIEARVQDFFGRSQGPAVANGRVPVVLHLLAPNRRPVQVTTDLAGFWARHWPAVRRELSRRYPRHAWPEDPLAASPPPRDGRGRRG